MVAPKCTLPSCNNGTGLPTVLSFSQSFQSYVFPVIQSQCNLSEAFSGQKLITRPVRLVKVCVCVHLCVRVHRLYLIALERASLRLSRLLNYLPAITSFLFLFFPLLQEPFRRHLANVLSSCVMILFCSISVCHIFRTL